MTRADPGPERPTGAGRSDPDPGPEAAAPPGLPGEPQIDVPLGSAPADDPGQAVRKARDGVLVVPLIGLILLTPPVAQIFAIEGTIAGVPIVFGYIFTVWALLILLARRAGRRMLSTETGIDTVSGRR